MTTTNENLEKTVKSLIANFRADDRWLALEKAVIEFWGEDDLTCMDFDADAILRLDVGFTANEAEAIVFAATETNRGVAGAIWFFQYGVMESR